MLTYHDQLVAALSTDYLSIAGVLLARGFISAEIHAQMLLSSTPSKMANILVNTVRDKIKVAPQLFPKLAKLFSEHTSTKGILQQSACAYQGKL